MLVLSRKAKETIVIGEGSNRIEITVQRLSHGSVKLGIEAAREVKILRGELPDGKEAA